MKVNAINSTMYMTKAPAFSHIAVPYPEYEKYSKRNQSSSVERIVDRLSALFTPEVTKKSQEIKNNINKIYDTPKQKSDFDRNKHLLALLA